MKRSIALAVVFIMAFSLTACGKKDRGNTVSVPVVDSNTVEIVENAYKNTEEVLKSVTALDVQSTVVKTLSFEGESFSERSTSKLSFINSDSGKSYAIISELKSGDIADGMQIYSDGKVTYGARAGETYILSKGKDTDSYVEGVFGTIKLGKVEGVKVINTTVVDTSTGGHGFVLEYDCTNADGEKLFGDYFVEKKAGFDVKYTKLTASGIVDAEGRLTAQTITLEYDYTYSVGAPVEDDSSDNASSTNTSSKDKTSSEVTSSVATEIITKTISAKLSIDNTFNYEIDAVKVPDLVEIGKDADGNDIKHEEISIQDFTGLTAGTSDKEENNKK